MSAVPRVAFTIFTLIAVTVAIVAIGETLDLGSPYYTVGLFAAMFLTSLTDRDRFYARDLRSPKRRCAAGQRPVRLSWLSVRPIGRL